MIIILAMFPPQKYNFLKIFSIIKLKIFCSIKLIREFYSAKFNEAIIIKDNLKINIKKEFHTV